MNMLRLETEAKLESLEEVMEFLDTGLEETGFDMKAKMQIELSVEELFVNIANYAYPEGGGFAVVTFEHDSEAREIKITFSDQGLPYDPLSKDDPDISLGADERQIGGLGVFLVKKNMDQVSYEYVDGRNVTTISKKY